MRDFEIESTIQSLLYSNDEDSKSLGMLLIVEYCTSRKMYDTLVSSKMNGRFLIPKTRRGIVRKFMRMHKKL